HGGDFAPSESWSGPDPDPDPNQNKQQHADSDSVQKKKIRETIFSGKGEKTKVQKEDSDVDTEEDGNQLVEFDSARNSFSLALKECQDRRLRCEALFKKQDRRRPASLDLNNANAIGTVSVSPRLGVGAMKKSTVVSRRSGSGTGTGTFPSPGTPNYRHCQGGVAMQKGWSSERVPSHTSGARKQVGNGAGTLCLSNGRTLPSKWEDAE
ncbi:remorin family protein, partial [Trifolium medium]|nr:remorin family protein [Trifolium medium]